MAGIRGGVSLVVLMLGATGAPAATPDVDGGQLVGAFDVVVGTLLYDVAFVDGTCPAVYGSCLPSSLPFSTLGDATDASEALLDQVFLGGFDVDPSLIAGCSDFEQCIALTPYGTSGAFLDLAAAINGDGFSVLDEVSSGSVGGLIDTVVLPDQVFVAWTPVPEADRALLLAAGLAGLACLALRRRYSSRAPRERIRRA